MNRLATPIVPEVHHIWAADDRVIIRFDGTATTTSGAPYANQFVWILRMEDGVVVEAEAFLDHLYNSQLPQSSLNGRTPIAALKDWQRQRPELFRKRV